jgi:hypothetical protein
VRRSIDYVDARTIRSGYTGAVHSDLAQSGQPLELTLWNNVQSDPATQDFSFSHLQCVWVGFITKKKKGGESMKIKVNVRAGGSTAKAR